MNDEPVSERSVGVAIWHALREQLADESDPFLSQSRFVLQRDAYGRLDDDDVVHDVPFVSYEYTDVTSDNDLPFAVNFYRYGLTLVLGPVSYDFNYKVFSRAGLKPNNPARDNSATVDAESVAKNVILTIKLLLNGQLVVNVGLKRRRIVMTEVFLLGARKRPLALFYDLAFKRFDKRATASALLQNRAIKEHVPVPDTYPLLPVKLKGEYADYGRTVDSVDDLPPLTKVEAEKIRTDIVLLQGLGKDPAMNIYRHLYATSIFWFVTIGYLAIALTLLLTPATSEVFNRFGGYMLLVLGGRFVIVFCSSYLLTKRKLKVDRGEPSVTMAFEKKFGAITGRVKRFVLPKRP